MRVLRSHLDLALRIAFFALAPFAIVRAAVLFPVWGALASVAVSLLVFVAAETIREWAEKRPFLRKVIARELQIEAFYRGRPSRPFIFYCLFGPLLPYWLWNRDARREFWLFKGYTLGSIALLLASTVYQYFTNWLPELSVRAYLPVVGMTLLVETFLVLWLLMPIATTVIEFHQSLRRIPLLLLLLLGLTSTTLAALQLLRRRDPVVSFATRERVRLRTAARKKEAHEAHLAALRAAWDMTSMEPIGVETDGKVEGPTLERAHAVLEQFYKHDEAFSFDLWASPLKHPKILVLYFEARPGKPPIWVATRIHGTEITDPKLLPRGAFNAMKHAADQ